MAKKKNKQKSDKKRQAKALKVRSRKKEIKKHAPKRQSLIPNLPGGMGGGAMSGQAQQLMKYSEPLVTAADPQDMKAMTRLSDIIKGFWGTFSEQDLEKREAMMPGLKELYERQPWARVDFETVAEYMLKRHIYFMPNAHSDEEKARFSEAELAEAGENNIFEVPEVDEAALAEAFDIPDFQPERAAELMGEPGFGILSGLHGSLKDKFSQADFINENDPVLNDILTFQNQTFKLFEAYLKDAGIEDPTVAAHLANVRPLFDPFLRTFHQAGIFTVEGEQVEEYAMDFFLRRLESEDKNPELLMTSLAAYFSMVEAMDYCDGAAEVLSQLLEFREEYEEMV